MSLFLKRSLVTSENSNKTELLCKRRMERAEVSAVGGTVWKEPGTVPGRGCS